FVSNKPFRECLRISQWTWRPTRLPAPRNPVGRIRARWRVPTRGRLGHSDKATAPTSHPSNPRGGRETGPLRPFCSPRPRSSAPDLLLHGGHDRGALFGSQAHARLD